ncbi:MAG: hypothetical protein ACJAU8_000502 [Candidatus Paceibacteria bacterium]|jgi:hypothetical protein
MTFIFRRVLTILTFAVLVFSFSQTTFAAAPAVTTLSPLDNATEIDVNANLVITFDQNTEGASDGEFGGPLGAIFIYKSSDDSVYDIYSYQDALVTGSGTTVITLDLDAPLQANTEYYIKIPFGSFDNAIPESYEGILDTTTWSFTTDASAYSGAGAGSTVDPFIITTCAEIVEARYFLDSAFSLEPIGGVSTLDCTANGNEIMFGNYWSGYTSTFSGNDVTVTVDIDESTRESIGFFRYIEGGTVTDLHIAGSVVGGDRYVGGFTGYIDGGGSVSGSSVTADVTGQDYDIGGFVGHVEAGSTITGSFATGNVHAATTGSSKIGGFVGRLEESTITDSYSTGSVTADDLNSNYVGGFVGYQDGGSITGSYAEGDVTVLDNSDSIGGFVGSIVSGAVIEGSYATGDVQTGISNEYVGGFAGYLSGVTITNSYAEGTVTTTGNSDYIGGFAGDTNTVVINRSYATGDVNGTGSSVGGFVGETDDTTITNSYARGDVTGADNVGGFMGYGGDNIVTNIFSTGLVTSGDALGGLLGDYSNDTFTNTYWDTETSGTTNGCDEGDCVGISGKSTSQMKKYTTFDNWDFKNIWGINSTDNNGYPFLRWEGYNSDSIRSASRSSGIKYGCKDATATNHQLFVRHQDSLCEYSSIDQGVIDEAEENTSSKNLSQSEILLNSKTCPIELSVTQNLRAPSRNGVFNSYTQGIVTEANILQGHLNRLGFNSGLEDGIIGRLTDGAIKRMQTFLGSIPDGYVGPITRGLLNESCGEGGLEN